MTVELDTGLSRVARDLKALGHRITSTVRTPEDNVRVGGSPGSLHLSGRAFDSVPGVESTWLELIADTVYSAKRHGVPVRLLLETDHVHTDLHPVPGLSVEVPPRDRGKPYARIYSQ